MLECRWEVWPSCVSLLSFRYTKCFRGDLRPVAQLAGLAMCVELGLEYFLRDHSLRRISEPDKLDKKKWNGN